MIYFTYTKHSFAGRVKKVNNKLIHTKINFKSTVNNYMHLNALRSQFHASET